MDAAAGPEDADAPLGGMPPAGDALALLTRRASRERAARKAAEELLDRKSRELYEALQRVRDSEHRLQMALWASGEGIWEWQSADDLFRVQSLRIEGQAQDWAPMSSHEYVARIVHDDREAVLRAWRQHVQGAREEFDVAYRLEVEGRRRWVRVRGRALRRDADGQARVVAGTIKDITRQREAEQSLHRLARAFASTQDALAVVDGAWRLVDVNEALCQLTGRPAAGLIGTALQAHLRLQGPPSPGWRGECELRVVGGEVPVEVSITDVDETALHARCHIVSIHDISDRRRAQADLERLALHDALTDLPNRASINLHLNRLLEGPQPVPFAVLFTDLDGFKEVNDSFGHRAGDLLLREVARRMHTALPQAMVGRWGGDEFVVTLPPPSDESAVREVSQVLIAALALPIEVSAGHPVRITPSIGAVLYPEHGQDAETLLRRADSAMYVAKAQGKNGLSLYTPEVEVMHLRRARLQNLLREDAQRSAFEFVVQPKVDREGRVCGGELLARWSTADFGWVSPAEFIPIAEQSGLIELLGRQALHTAARLVRAAREAGVGVPLAVNLSPRQLLNPDFVRMTLRACERYGIEPGHLELELTESALASGLDVVQPLLQHLRGQGFGLALDDFGTGYSSLSHLLHLPFRKVKIDRSFVRGVDADGRARALVQGTLQICAGLGLSTVAEGVETPAQFAALRDLGVDEFQGYLFSRPLAQGPWLALLASGRSLPGPAAPHEGVLS